MLLPLPTRNPDRFYKECSVWDIDDYSVMFLGDIGDGKNEAVQPYRDSDELAYNRLHNAITSPSKTNS